MSPERPSGGEKFKSQIEQGVERALPAERVEGLEGKIKEKTKKSNALKRKVRSAIKKSFTDKETQDLAITPAEKQQVYEKVLSTLSNKLGGTDKAKKMLRSFGIKSARNLMQKIGLSRLSEQRTYEHYLYAAKKGPGVCFRDYDKIVDQPWGKDILEKAFNNKHEYVFAFADKFKKEPEFAKKLLLNAAAKSPKLVFHYVEKFKHMKGAEDILQKSVTLMEKTDIAFEGFNKYSDMPWAVNILVSATEKNRDDALIHLSRYKKSPEASQVLLTAIGQMEDTEEFFSNIDEKLKGVQGIKNVLAIAAIKNPNAAILNFEKYNDIDDPGFVIKSAIISMTDTDMIFYAVEKFTGLKGYGDILMQAALKADADAVFDAYFEFKDIPSAVPILTMAINKSPETVFKRPDILGELPKKVAADLLNTSAFTNPDLVFKNIDTILKYDESGRQFLTVATTNPMLIYENLSKLEGKISQSVRDKILNTAFQNLKPEDYMCRKKIKITEPHLTKEQTRTIDYMSIKKIKIIGPHLTKKQVQTIKDKINQCREFANKFLAQNMHTAAEGYYQARSSTKMRENLFADKGLRDILKVKSEWIKVPKNSNLQSVQARAMIARNLYTDGIPVTKDSVQKELKRIIEERNKLKNTPIFKGRNVIHVAQNQKKHGKNVFGKVGTLRAISEQSNSMEALRCKPTKEQIKKFKQRLIDKIADTKPPLTFYYSGHGSGKTVELIHIGKFKLSLTPADLATALKLRHENFKDDPIEKQKPPIIIISACYTANFARKMYAKIKNNTSKPITMGGSEFGQVSYGERIGHKYGSRFEEKVLGLGSEIPGLDFNKPSTFGTVIENEQNNPSNIYANLPSRKQVI